MLEDIRRSNACLKERTKLRPRIAIVLGTGLGSFADKISVVDTIPYNEIPGFKTSTVQGHSGKLLFGTLDGIEVMAMQGRLHYYEGYTMQEITFPIRVMKEFGIKVLMVSNAAGGLNPDYIPGDIMIIKDHINLFPEHPLHGPNIEELGVRFPDMSNAYDKKLIALSDEINQRLSLNLKKGVYVGTQGPTFETLSEYRYFRIIGGDSCGMSTVPEVIVANHAGLSVFGVSVISNVGVDANLSNVTHEEVQQNTLLAQDKLAVLFTEMVKACHKIV
ncbi:MAG: purine-nucleoside phosphorylase [Paludibacteraceae bacterium]|nr:purine-nucleoside phosphorylase [Paludibacteraceae bacterium]MBO7636131.1 purine-nucleoside phosphorylase [Paludibacteraceae bacterium]MBR5971596.1 purine-nucleoside phosphorylase [Paludibacteraceae bacterium]